MTTGIVSAMVKPRDGYALTNPNVKIRERPGMIMWDAADLEQIPWVESPYLPGMKSKYVHIDIDTGQVVALLLFRKGLRLPVHIHFGTSLLFCLKGKFGYQPAGSIGAGGFGFEPVGIVHEPDTLFEEETMMWAINSHGELLQFFNEDGSPGDIVHIDANLRRIRREYGFEAVKHLRLPSGFWDE